MSYCVNCGVELDDSAEKCVLCDTKVVNPNVKQEKEDTLAPFSQEKFVPLQVKKRFVAGILSLIAVITNLVCVLSNALLFNENGWWSFEILRSSALLWIVFVFPLFFKKTRKFLMWAFDSVAIGLYAGFWFYINVTLKIYFIVALPIIVFTSLLVFIYMLWVTRKKRNSILKVVFIFCDIALCSLFSGLMLYFALGLMWAFATGLILFLSILAVIIFLSFCYKNKTVREWLSKKLFV